MGNKKQTIDYFKKCRRNAELEIADAIEATIAKFEKQTGYIPSDIDISIIKSRTIHDINDGNFLNNVNLVIEI